MNWMQQIPEIDSKKQTNKTKDPGYGSFNSQLETIYNPLGKESPGEIV